MKKILRTATGSALLLICLAGAAKSKTYDSQCYWTNAEMKIDGKSNDWQIDKGAFLADQNAVIATCNDKAFLYLLFRTNDINWVRTIKMRGITLYFDPKGGKSKDFSLHYRGGPDIKQLMAGRTQNDSMHQMHPEWQHQGGESHPDSLMKAPSLTCNIKDWLIEKELSFDGTEGPTAAFDTSQGFYTYEFRVPLTEASVRYYGINAEAGQKVSVGAIWGGMDENKRTKPHLQGGFGGFDDDMGGGGGRMGGDMMGGGKMSAHAGEHHAMPKKQEVWVKAALAPFSAPATSPESVSKNDTRQ